ncbi:MAG TPA: mandelate racemase/muconate lactonizing enzyme family protein [Dehalococcoidia bacterium]|nr:mandelate racemase/muconate lactonizing enzyme family protein [Dehalococcoidia bacterium]
MKVTGYETWVARVPYEEGRFGMHIVLRLTTDDGLRGVGYVSNLTPWSLKAQRAAIEAFAEQVVGQDPLHVESINAKLLYIFTRIQLSGLANSAAGVVDIALWDLKAQALGQPLHRLLGAADNTVPAYASWNLWWSYDLATLVRHAREHVDRGFRQMKYRLGGVQDVAQAVERTRVLREAVGDDIELMTDINWSWSVNQALEIGRALQPYRLFWIEDPISAHDYDGLARVNREVQTRIAAGEVYHEAPQFTRLLENRCVDALIVDLEAGGITQWLKIAALAEAYRVPVASHTCTEVGAQLVAGIRNGLTVEYLPWAEPLFQEVPQVEDGRLVLSQRAGLGLELDEAALKRFEYH